MTEPATRDALWSSADAAATLWPAAFGAVLMLWSWWEASGSASLDDQTGWVVVGVLGFGMSAFGLLAWLRAGRRAVRRRRQEVIAATESFVFSGEDLPTLSADDVGLVFYPGSPKYHRVDCLLVKGKPVKPLPAAAPQGISRRCEMCDS